MKIQWHVCVAYYSFFYTLVSQSRQPRKTYVDSYLVSGYQLATGYIHSYVIYFFLEIQDLREVIVGRSAKKEKRKLIRSCAERREFLYVYAHQGSLLGAKDGSKTVWEKDLVGWMVPESTMSDCWCLSDHEDIKRWLRGSCPLYIITICVAHISFLPPIPYSAQTYLDTTSLICFSRPSTPPACKTPFTPLLWYYTSICSSHRVPRFLLSYGIAQVPGIY